MDKQGYEYLEIDFLPFQEKYPSMKFNKLTPVAPVQIVNKEVKTGRPTDAWWVFQCDCGNKICHRMAQVRNGKITNCGCEKEQKDKYIGQTYNYLTIIEKDNNYKKEHNIKGNGSYYKCQCKCGNFKTVRLSMITSGGVKSCGCLKKEQEKENLVHGYSFKDLTNKKFGLLTVLNREHTDSNGDIFWRCQCECGAIKIIRGASLRNQSTISCGCLKISSGEYKIKQLLIEANIPFIFDSIYFKDLILPSGGYGRYDFILLKNNEPYWLIEFDGEQHYQPVEYFGGEKTFSKLKENDLYKNKYAYTHNLPLTRIPYTEINNITLDSLFSEKFLVKHD